MSGQSLRLAASRAQQTYVKPTRDARPVGRILVDMGRLSEGDLTKGLEQQRRLDAPLGDILIYERFIQPSDLTEALAEQHGITLADLSRLPPDPELAGLIDVDICLQYGVVPWRRVGAILLVATARPDLFDDLIAQRPMDSFSVQPVLSGAADIRAAQQRMFGPTLAWRAERRVPADMSCRSILGTLKTRVWMILTLLAGCAGAASLSLHTLWSGLALIALGTMLLSLGLKLAATGVQLWHEVQRGTDPPALPDVALRLPQVSVMVPLLKEKEIAGALIKRLSKLTYPKALLDVVLVLEEADAITRDTLARTDLPPWMRVVEVPSGSGLTTKPRALNYALDFCRGSIVGVWDAEDAPAHDQIEQVVNRFRTAPPEVACLQGKLDYYNPTANWVARCFTIEYAAWWRLIMPGLARLNMVIPLGGTTLFFRRAPLEDLGGWDAHNVTEDADLGLRLARAGYRTELIDTVTYEEANCRPWAWVRQRSRWLKGFAITWAVHMRRPRQLWRDLGTYRFLSLQVFYLAALSQFILAPVFWLFWLLPLGLPNPFGTGWEARTLIWVFLGCEAATILMHVAAVRRAEHRHLTLWTPLMTLYFVMGCAAVYKALYEVIRRPFFWDKTQHGVTPEGLGETAPQLGAVPKIRS